MLHIALSKGRLAKKALGLLEKCGVDTTFVDMDSRKLIFEDEKQQLSIILVKPSDVPTYVERGVSDIGVVGKDTLMEQSKLLYEMLDLGFGACKLCIAGPVNKPQSAITNANLRVATKYPNVARSFYSSRGQSIDIIKMNGSVELGPLVGLSDVILDIVESGATLRENGLAVQEEICDSSARLVVNKVSLKTKAERITPLLEMIRKALEA